MAPSHMPWTTSALFLGQFAGGGRARRLADHRLADGAEADIGDDIGADALGADSWRTWP